MIHDVKPATNFMERAVAQTNYSLIGLSIRRKKIEVKSPDMFNDSILAIDRNTGCYFKGEKLIHTNKCECGEE